MIGPTPLDGDDLSALASRFHTSHGDHGGAFHSPSSADSRWQALMRQHKITRALLTERRSSFADIIEGMKIDIEILMYVFSRRRYE
jgi:hypothetical protein